MENLVSVKEAAIILAVKVPTIRTWMREKKDFPALRTGRHIKFLPSELIEWTRQQQVEYLRNKEKKLRPQRGPKPKHSAVAR